MPILSAAEADDGGGSHEESNQESEANDPVAIRQMGVYNHIIEGDYESAFENYTKAFELGDLEAHYHLGVLHSNGEGVNRDPIKEMYHFEQAAIGGHPAARHDLGNEELKNGKTERAVKHFIIAANLGYDTSLETLRKGYPRE